jgi:hypothetical protein
LFGYVVQFIKKKQNPEGNGECGMNRRGLLRIMGTAAAGVVLDLRIIMEGVS